MYVSQHPIDTRSHPESRATWTLDLPEKKHRKFYWDQFHHEKISTVQYCTVQYNVPYRIILAVCITHRKPVAAIVLYCGSNGTV